MPIHFQWLVQEKILLGQFIGDINTEDIAQSDHDANTLLDQATSERVHFILDMSAQTAMPPIRDLTPDNSFFKHPRVGWVVGFGISNKVVYFAGLIVSQFFGMQMRMVKNFDEALHFLQGIDTNLPSLTGLLKPDMERQSDKT